MSKKFNGVNSAKPLVEMTKSLSHGERLLVDHTNGNLENAKSKWIPLEEYELLRNYRIDVESQLREHLLSIPKEDRRKLDNMLINLL